MILDILRILLTVILAYLVGKLVSKLKLPAILGWLVAGMVFGPHALGLLDTSIMNSTWFTTTNHLLECAVGLMIGTELVIKRIKKTGKQIIVTTLTQSLGTFFFVTFVFGVLFYFTDVPLYLAFIFGGIALATAPAPALSIVREFRTDGPVTKTLIPMAALDDIVAVVVFFTTMATISAKLGEQGTSLFLIPIVVLLPILLGVLSGFFFGFLLKKDRNKTSTLLILFMGIFTSAALGFVFNELILPAPLLNFMLIGMAYSATFSNLVSEERLEEIMRYFQPFLGIALILVILNLGAPLDYHLILGAGIYTAIYIFARAIGKFSGAYFGAHITKSPKTVQKYLGLTLLPHSGVSLVFTGIAVQSLTVPAPECAKIIQGTIAAAAVINEIIAVLLAKKAFEWAGEMK